MVLKQTRTEGQEVWSYCMAESRRGSFRCTQGGKARRGRNDTSLKQPGSRSIPCARAWTEAAVSLCLQRHQKPPSSLVWTGGISPIAGREVGAEVLQENLVTVLLWWCSSGEAHLVYLPPLYLQVPVDEPVGLKVIIILPKRVDELLGHLHVESTQQRSPLPLSLQGEVRCDVP